MRLLEFLCGFNLLINFLKAFLRNLKFFLPFISKIILYPFIITLQCPDISSAILKTTTISDLTKDLVSTRKSSKRRRRLRFTTGMDGTKTKTENIENSLKSIPKCLKTVRKGDKKKFFWDLVNRWKLEMPINAEATIKRWFRNTNR